jgi:hypothetical protein
MKKLLFLSVFTFSFQSYAQNANWSIGTAQTLPKHRFETGVFHPLQYGYSSKTEFSTFPLLNFLMPNIGIKRSLYRRKNFYLTFKRTMNYPTPLLKAISKRGIMGILPDDTKVPHIFLSTNEFLATYIVSPKLILTLKTGIDIAHHSGKMSMVTIDLPILFTRTAAIYNRYSLNGGLDIQGKIYKKFFYLIDFDLFIMPGHEAQFAFEHKFMLSWRKSEKFSIMAGYKFVYGSYPFGEQTHIFPLIDLCWGF